MESNYTKAFSEVGLEDVELVGGKNASLGEMIQNLSLIGIRVPDGYAITVNGFDAFLEFNEISDRIEEILKGLDVNDIISLRKTGLAIRQIIEDGKFPVELAEEIIDEYRALSMLNDQDFTDVAVRSSATAEDLPDASFAGQQETYLNVRGEAALLSAVKSCFASLYTDRAISYRESMGYSDMDVKLSVGVQKMVRADLGKSGVAFSLDTESGFKDVVLINGTYGLGELVVQGMVSPDEFIVFKPTLKDGFNAVIEKKLGDKYQKMVYSNKPHELTKIGSVPKGLQNEYCLSDRQILELSNWVCVLEDYYSEKYKKWCPVDVEWAIDGITNQLFIVQARPETIHSQKNQHEFTEYRLKEIPIKPIVEGIAVGDRIGSGVVKVLTSLDTREMDTDPNAFKAGDILVTEMTDPDWEPLMKIASAIITEKGGRTCHAAIVARELGVPAIVGTGNVTELVTDGQIVTVSCSQGNVGYVYEGRLEIEITKTNTKDVEEVRTPIKLNVASPDLAYKFAHIPNAGVGLAREEFIINNYIQVHPLALLNHKKLGDTELTSKIQTLMKGYESEKDFFVGKLASGIAKIASAFYPNEVIVRFSDFKSNEYANLLGGSYFEPKEENPMLGWRGASRYYSEAYKEAFGMECEAIRRVREEMGLENVVVMIPFCRTVGECEKVLDTMNDFDLPRGRNGLKVYLMAELPSNIILASEFADHIDGFSIGSNDLTQLTLGLDRDSHLVSHIYDERNEAVKMMIRKLIKDAHEKNIPVGICGQAPSDFPDFAEFLVELGIDSISITPDSVLKTMKAIAAIEKRILKKVA